tara:strand:+ start:327 stop:947 length:621 start_codon:yes stop_codon:yes gene_type:complete
MIEITKLPIFVEEVNFFTMPNHEYWKEKILNIVKVEDNKNIHKFTTQIDEDCNVKANRTAWDSHFRYPAVTELTEKILDIIHLSVTQDGYDAPNLVADEAWINWYKKKQFAVPHTHGCHMAVVYFVDTEDTNSNFIFTRNDHFRLSKKEDEKTITNISKQINIKDGTVIFFNGNLWHAVSANLSDKLRVTYASNVKVEYYKQRENN